MAFGDKAAGGVDDTAATVGDVAVSDHDVSLARRAEAESIEGDEFIGGEAVVEFDEGDLTGRDAGFGEGLSGGVLGHAVAD